MKVYLAGPMSGYPNLNFAHFHEMATKLRDAGYTVINPAELNGEPTADGGATYEDWLRCMRVDIEELIYCDAVAVLDGWDKSRGARTEHALALNLGLPTYCAYQLAKKPAASLLALPVRGMTEDRAT